MHFSAPVSVALLALAHLVAGHGVIIKAVGDMGGAGSALGVDPNTPRTGKTRNPFQQDTTRFKGAAANTCGSTREGGANDIETGTKAVLAMNGGMLPQISAGGQLMMTLHQINTDGAGPYTCEIDATGTGTTWTSVQVTSQIPGKRGNNRATSLMDQPLNVAIPAGQTCSGNVAGQQNVCMVRCMNPARAGPFGGCVPVQMAAAAAAAPAASAASPSTNSTTSSAASSPVMSLTAGTNSTLAGTNSTAAGASSIAAVADMTAAAPASAATDAADDEEEDD